MRNSLLLALCCGPALLCAQDNAMQQVLERLDRLEQQNRALLNEVQALRQQIGRDQPPPVGATAVPEPVEERVQVQERRIEELQETKVEASQKRPLSITGMVLFNSFLNSHHSGTADFPTIASLNRSGATGGGSFRQSVIGFKFYSPSEVLGARVTGSLYLDLFANQPQAALETYTDADAPPQIARGISVNLGRLVRLRVATVSMEWKNRTLTVGQDKPIVSPREPNSLAQVGISPLTAAGNPWLWQPQIRYEERFHLTDRSTLTAQAGIFQTAEGGATISDKFAPSLESARPGLEGRVELRHELSNGGHIEFAPSIHASTTHVALTSVPSRLYGVDWSIAPWRKLDFSGMFFTGENTANLGTLRQGFTIFGLRNVIPIHSKGGWGQLSYIATPRLTFNMFSGQQDDRNRDLNGSGIGKNWVYAGNAMYRLAPNVILSFESSQTRTTYIGAGQRLNNHYDLALAYLF